LTAHRRERQGAILRLVQERPIATQSELADALHEAGFDVVQTTVSRDVAELRLVKVRHASGRLVYAPAGTANGDRMRELVLALRRWALAFEASGNLIVVSTPSGYANALAQVVDETGHPHIAGTIAGDNTILLVAREGVTGSDLANELRHHLLEGAA
jgi:transcriptional regulator of arginine metabolism